VRCPENVWLIVLFVLISIGSSPLPLSFQKLNHGLLKGWLIRRGVVVAFTLPGPCRRDRFQKPGNLLIGGVYLPVKDKYGYSDSLEAVGGQGFHQDATNDRRQHFRISSCNPRRDEVR